MNQARYSKWVLAVTETERQEQGMTVIQSLGKATWGRPWILGKNMGKNNETKIVRGRRGEEWSIRI